MRTKSPRSLQTNYKHLVSPTREYDFLSSLASHDLAVLHAHSIWVAVRVKVLLLLEVTAEALALRYWAIFVLQ